MLKGCLFFNHFNHLISLQVFNALFKWNKNNFSSVNSFISQSHQGSISHVSKEGQTALRRLLRKLPLFSPSSARKSITNKSGSISAIKNTLDYTVNFMKGKGSVSFWHSEGKRRGDTLAKHTHTHTPFLFVVVEDPENAGLWTSAKNTSLPT